MASCSFATASLGSRFLAALYLQSSLKTRTLSFDLVASKVIDYHGIRFTPTSARVIPFLLQTKRTVQLGQKV